MKTSFFGQVLDILQRYWPSLALGVQNTLIISLTGTMIGLVIGMIVGGVRAIRLDFNAPAGLKTGKKILDFIGKAYIDVFRGTPMMVQAVFLYYALLNVIHWDKLTAAIFVISINTGAYMAEIIRSGIQAVDSGQTEAARSLGMSNIQTMSTVVLPQAVRNAFPAIGNEFIVNIKDSSVLMIISIADLMFQAKSIAGSTFQFTATYGITAAIYFMLTSIASMILNMIERKMNTSRTSFPQSSTDPSSMTLAARSEGGHHRHE